MKLVLGLGNPTKQYDLTRHNIGKSFIDYLTTRRSLPVHKSSARYTSYLYKDTVIAKSEVFMNLSAQALEGILKSYPNITLANTVVVLDDLDHKAGNARIKSVGSAE